MKNFVILSVLALATSLLTFGQESSSSSSITSKQTNSAPQTTLIKACQDLSEHDDCQFHDDQAKRLVSGQCKMKALAGNNLTLLCIADKPTEPMDSSAETSSSEGNHKHNRKRHSD